MRTHFSQLNVRIFMMRPCYAAPKIGRFRPKAGGITVGAGTAVFAFFLSRTSAPASLDYNLEVSVDASLLAISCTYTIYKQQSISRG